MRERRPGSSEGSRLTGAGAGAAESSFNSEMRRPTEFLPSMICDVYGSDERDKRGDPCSGKALCWGGDVVVWKARLGLCGNTRGGRYRAG